MQIESSTASLELLTCDLTNKDEAININKVTANTAKITLTDTYSQATVAVNKAKGSFNKEVCEKSMMTIKTTLQIHEKMAPNDPTNLPSRLTQQWAKYVHPHPLFPYIPVISGSHRRTCRHHSVSLHNDEDRAKHPAITK